MTAQQPGEAATRALCSASSTTTWREAIRAACAAVREAEAERNRVLLAAHNAGLSTRNLAKAAEVGHSTVWRWLGGKNGQPGPSLDDAASFAEPNAPRGEEV